MPKKSIGTLRLLRASPRERVRLLLESSGASCTVRTPEGEVMRFGGGDDFEISIHDWQALRGFDDHAIARAYVNGGFEIEGDMLKAIGVRALLSERAGLAEALGFWLDLFFRRAARVNRRAIEHHYSFGDDFYHLFIDTKYRFYSHGIFRDESESIEQASEHKLEQMFEALELEPGMHLLDIGGGWGPVMRYCCDRGVRVTSLTIAEDSFEHLGELIRRERYDAEVLREDFLEHRPTRPYDACVIYGVIEHIPRYRRFVERAWECLPPRGRLYLDASASLEKFNTSGFAKEYIWPGTHAFLYLPDLLREYFFGGFELLSVKDERRDYELTMLEWARRFDAQRETVIARWGETVYRAFRLYLWGGCYEMATNGLQAYSVVARRSAAPGPRPGLWRRVRSFVAGLA